MQQRDGRWYIVDLVGKHGRIRGNREGDSSVLTPLFNGCSSRIPRSAKTVVRIVGTPKSLAVLVRVGCGHYPRLTVPPNFYTP